MAAFYDDASITKYLNLSSARRMDKGCFSLRHIVSLYTPLLVLSMNRMARFCMRFVRVGIAHALFSHLRRQFRACDGFYLGKKMTRAAVGGV